ncbi:MAG: hypothetical protein KTR13_10255 [Saprospiraceae bacterium]|nr:hypothetical protein [Saprospiraceae bacterium]
MIALSIGLIILCCIVIWRASDGFDVASQFLGRRLSEGVRGATINAIGSSMPELFTTFFFLFILKDRDGFAGGIGTTAGSAVFNGMIIPAVVILVVIFSRLAKNIEVSRKVLFRDGIALLLCELVLIYILGGNSLNWIHGLILMSLYAAYAWYMLTTMKATSEEATFQEETATSSSKNWFLSVLSLDLEPLFIRKQINTANAWTLLLVALLIIGSACLLLVKSCEQLGDELGVPIYFIAVILASAATSVPDTILSIKDAKKGNYDDAVSNALGSNIFDVCFALGFPLFLFTLLNGPIEMSAETVINVAELRILLFILTAVAFLIYIARKTMTIGSAILLLTIYIIFTLYIFGRSAEVDIAMQISDWLRSIDDFIDPFRFWKT